MIRIFISCLLLFMLSCKSDKRYHDVHPQHNAEVPQASATLSEEILKMRKKKDELFTDPGRSPLPENKIRDFKGLRYFAVDSGYMVEAVLERAMVPKIIQMETTTGEVRLQEEYGTLNFRVSGSEFRLKVFRDPEILRKPSNENYLFLPFTDKTNGVQTYGGGRYLDLSIPEKDTLWVDFNKAYNPYCAYNGNYSCPLVPPENHLEVAIEAGEQQWP